MRKSLKEMKENRINIIYKYAYRRESTEKQYRKRNS